MEQMLYHTRRPESTQTRAPIVTVSPFTVSLLLTLVSLFAGGVFVITRAKSFGQEQLPDPFAAYTDVFPGQHVDIPVLEAQGFSCKEELQPALGDMNQICSSIGRTEQVSLFNVAIRDGVVMRLDLKLQKRAFTIGDLVLRWGTPDIQVSGSEVNLTWREWHITASGAAETGQFSYFQSVAWLSVQ